ncbi:hypothetical protein BDP55DRAFT_662870 [Colletotrichum godetiae]|uniref:Uncharacterized protein n=1 Tax=Colletotrichum godetiae TaxID=1209918 RepID=A0AAJ0AMI7_9PEZI|nr:uncharacterized protein BDP55DRAFT_662870 [Colletotrichum godetiae]KAK1675989.1 hypothetical protein BDP55DRAFT_662870 [Colletotrichum godetiae]
MDIMQQMISGCSSPEEDLGSRGASRQSSSRLVQWVAAVRRLNFACFSLPVRLACEDKVRKRWTSYFRPFSADSSFILAIPGPSDEICNVCTRVFTLFSSLSRVQYFQIQTCFAPSSLRLHVDCPLSAHTQQALRDNGSRHCIGPATWVLSPRVSHTLTPLSVHSYLFLYKYALGHKCLGEIHPKKSAQHRVLPGIPQPSPLASCCETPTPPLAFLFSLLPYYWPLLCPCWL